MLLFKSVVASLCVCTASCSGKSRPDWVASDLFTASMPAFKASDTAAMSEFYDKLRPRKTMGSDAEHMDALLHYFFGKFDGVAMELGAVDGNKLSETKIFVDVLGWRRILVEANPLHRPALSNMSHAFAACAAVCAGAPADVLSDRIVHFVQNRHESGILEFFPESHMRKSFPNLMPAATFVHDSTGKEVSVSFNRAEVERHIRHYAVSPVPCVPLSRIIKEAGVSHVDFFVLDVEGGELEVLHSIDWAAVTFDVLVVETEATHRRQGYAAEVAAFLALRGYTAVLPAVPGRNSWFLRDGFTPSASPRTKAGCFRGALEVSKIRRVPDALEFETKNC